MVPLILNSLLRKYGEERNGPFRLTNRDFGAHNILVNENYDIVGVIDFDGIMAAPIEAVAQLPLYCGAQTDPPGKVYTNPMAIERVALNLPHLDLYKKLLASCEDELCPSPDNDSLKVAPRLATTRAFLHQGLVEYQQQQDFVNEDWLKSCLIMVQELTQS